MNSDNTHTRGSPVDSRLRPLHQVTGSAGLASMLLIFVPAIARSGLEPSFGGSSADVVEFLKSIQSPLDNLGSFIMTVGLIAFLWFIIGLSVLLAKAEGDLPWRSAIAAASGLLQLALALAANTEAAAFRAADIDPQIARYAFDEGNLSFANGWVALGSFALCAGWVVTSTRTLPRWLGWWAIASGIGMALSRAIWTSELWLLPYAAFWLWVASSCIVLLHQTREASHTPSSHFGNA